MPSSYTLNVNSRRLFRFYVARNRARCTYRTPQGPSGDLREARCKFICGASMRCRANFAIIEFHINVEQFRASILSFGVTPQLIPYTVSRGRGHH